MKSGLTLSPFCLTGRSMERQETVFEWLVQRHNVTMEDSVYSFFQYVHFTPDL